MTSVDVRLTFDTRLQSARIALRRFPPPQQLPPDFLEYAKAKWAALTREQRGNLATKAARGIARVQCQSQTFAKELVQYQRLAAELQLDPTPNLDPGQVAAMAASELSAPHRMLE